MKPWHSVLLAFLALPSACVDNGSTRPTMSPAALQSSVLAAERAFAKTMADRNFSAFQKFVSNEAVFYSGETAWVGKVSVAESWRGFFSGPAAFSWEPDHVQVLASGDLALSTGPVRNPEGKITGRFNSIWRLESDGVRRVVFDRGSPVCGPR